GSWRTTSRSASADRPCADGSWWQAAETVGGRADLRRDGGEAGRAEAAAGPLWGHRAGLGPAPGFGGPGLHRAGGEVVIGGVPLVPQITQQPDGVVDLRVARAGKDRDDLQVRVRCDEVDGDALEEVPRLEEGGIVGAADRRAEAGRVLLVTDQPLGQ